MQIKLNFDTSAANAPTGFESAIQDAANILDATIKDPINVTISVGYGTYAGSAMTGTELGEAAPTGIEVSYSQLLTDLRGVATSATDKTFLADLPATDPNNGGSYFLSTAQEKALGLLSATSTEVDGYAGFSNTASFDYNPANGVSSGQYDLVGVALHELTHVLGRYAPGDLVTSLDLMSYGTNAQIDTNNATPHYLSLNGGKTNLANFNVSSDPGDFAPGTPTDPFNAFLNAGAVYGLTPLDSQVLDALGYNVGAAGPPPPSPNDFVILPNNGTITDKNGNTWSISTGLQVVVDGSVDPTTQSVVQMDYVNGVIWQENNSGLWYSKVLPNDTWSSPVNTAPIPPPSISGTVAGQTVASNGTIRPFSGVSITDPVANANEAVTITEVDAAGNTSDANGKLSGAGLTETSAGVYHQTAGSPSTVSAALQQLVFTPSNTNPSAPITTDFTVGVMDQAASLLGGAIANDHTTSVIQQPVPHVPPPGVTNGPPDNFLVSDQTSGGTWQSAGQAYSGPVAGLSQEIIIATSDNINVNAEVPNVFIHTGSGMDGITVNTGNNIVDGSTNSNFLIGGTGDDTFYMDDRNPTTPIFSTIVNFHAGDNATVWGINQSSFHMTVLDNQGAAGATGVDLIFSAPGHVDTSFVLAGYTSADLTNGRLSMSYGQTPDLPGLPGSEYMTLHAT